jgi:hypothetical protein
MISQQVARPKILSSVTHTGSLAQLRESVGHRSSSCTVRTRPRAESTTRMCCIQTHIYVCNSASYLYAAIHGGVGPTNPVSLHR